jgi:hypothetical protein
VSLPQHRDAEAALRERPPQRQAEDTVADDDDVERRSVGLRVGHEPMLLAEIDPSRKGTATA